MRPTAVIGAPTAIGISPYRDGGARRLDLTPGVLREFGLVERLAAVDLGDAEPETPYRDIAKPDGRIRNEDGVVAYSRRLGQCVAEASAKGHFIVLVGGDCSILLGSLLGLRGVRGHDVGLVYIDAHADFASPEESLSGSACSMNLALAVGRGEGGALARLAGESPLVEPSNVVHVGRRDDSDDAYGGEALRSSPIAEFAMPLVRVRGADAVAAEILERVAAIAGGFWIHLDVDALDPGIMPAVDSPLPHGFSIEEITSLMEPLVRHPAALGVQVTIYDPTLDTSRSGARLLVDLLAEVLGGGQGS
jgi:arginase